jgi:Family of unknown function (DUF5338)
MSKNDTVDGKAAKIRGQNLVPFLAHLEKIRTEHAAGWPVKAIYNRYAETLDMSYIQFNRYVNRYIRDVKPSESKPQRSSEGTAPQPVPTDAPRKEGGFKQFVPGPKDPDPKELW